MTAELCMTGTDPLNLESATYRHVYPRRWMGLCVCYRECRAADCIDADSSLFQGYKLLGEAGQSLMFALRSQLFS